MDIRNFESILTVGENVAVEFKRCGSGIGYLSPEIIEYQEKTVIHVHVPPSAEVHSYKKVIYDRVDDADVKVTSTGQIAQMYIRKQGIFTEKKVYPYAGLEDLRLVKLVLCGKI